MKELRLHRNLRQRPEKSSPRKDCCNIEGDYDDENNEALRRLWCDNNDEIETSNSEDVQDDYGGAKKTEKNKVQWCSVMPKELLFIGGRLRRSRLSRKSTTLRFFPFFS